MKIYTGRSGIDSAAGQQEAKNLVEEALSKINPQYVELFDRAGGTICIEGVIDGKEGILGESRYPRDIAVKTAAVASDTLDRTLTEEIIHYLDHYLRFSERGVFGMQEAANADAEHPLSLAMLAAIRGGTKGLESIEDVFKGSPTNVGQLMAEFNKNFPFLGSYRNGHNMNKYEWLAEVEHAECTLSNIRDFEQAQLLSMRTQRNMPIVLMLRFLSNHGFDIIEQAQKTAHNEVSPAAVKNRIDQIARQYNFNDWARKLASKVDLSKVKVDDIPDDALSKITLAVANAFMQKADYPLSEPALQKLMITMFPESYYALKSFRDEVDRELTSLKRNENIDRALSQSGNDQDLRNRLATSTMDEVALRNLQGHISPEAAQAIEGTLRIFGLIRSHQPGSEEPTRQVTQLLRQAWPDIRIDGKTIMEYAAGKEMYVVASAIRDAARQSAPAVAPPLP